MGMGEAFTAVADDANALSYNAGGLGLVTHAGGVLTPDVIPKGVIKRPSSMSVSFAPPAPCTNMMLPIRSHLSQPLAGHVRVTCISIWL